MRLDLAFGFDFYYAVTKHPWLGWILQPRAVQLTETGNFSLKNQKLNQSTAELFEEKLTQDDFEIIRTLDCISPESITKKFSSKEKIKPKDFFQRLKKRDFQQEIQPYIEKILAEVIGKLTNQKIFLEEGEHLSLKPVTISKKIATVLFHFRNTPESTRYFLTIKNNGNKVNFMKNGSVLISQTPPWLLAEGVLMTFEGHIDGKKIKPFVKKKFIEIPQRTKEDYFQNFIPQIIENYHVYAQGFAIETLNVNAKAKLFLMENTNGQLCFELKFDYQNRLIDVNPQKPITAHFNKEKNTFYRIKRIANWENDIINYLKEQGLHQLSSGKFIPDSQINPVEWIIENKETISHKIDIDQSLLSKNYLIKKAKFDLSVESDKDNDWFDLQGKVLFGTFELPFKKIISYIKRQIHEFELPDGTIATIPQEWFARLDQLLLFNNSKDGLKLNRSHFSIVENSVKKSIEANQNIVSFSAIDTPLPLETLFTLRPYQKEGFRWIQFLKTNNFGGILADDMGLGKTIQTIALLLKEKEENKSKRKKYTGQQVALFEDKTSSQTSLIVVPTSLVFNWISEINKFGPSIKTTTYIGYERQNIYNELMNFDVVISTYGVIRNDIEQIQKLHFNYLIIDEAQAIKNASSQSNKSILKICANHKLALTGTPIENRLTDLWSIMNCVNPGLLGNQKFFQNTFANPIEKFQNEKSAQTLKTLIAPFILRRTKENVVQDLPPVNHSVKLCEMTPNQEKFYETIKSKFRNELLTNIEKNGFEKSKINILSGLTQLRLAANHPKLVDPDFEGESGKYQLLFDMIEEAKSQHHKVLVFSQFVKQLKEFSVKLEQMNIRFTYIDGQTPTMQREKEVYAFQNNPDITLFLISLKAGGTGLNLTAADYVFIADPWWNPATENQAIARAHRIGQKNTVFSYKFICRNSVEEKILQLQKRKSSLASDLISANKNGAMNIQMEDFNKLFQ
ncbi:MAG: helicase SNF2 [Bacteroidetes bacterium MED-G17]|nr:MAG: helicase SNF2 [Bacteroidetes bacterium MED-G17]